jgi:transcriptional regulator with PAS, ATPase and Fis domain
MNHAAAAHLQPAGAFTGALKQKKGIFENAGKGTVFLDEFGEISPKLQVSLLRVLESNEIRMISGSETKKINCRIIIATNVDLKKAVAEKLFREDLYFRLSRFEIKIPSLRERITDLPLIINFFLKNNYLNTGVQIKLSSDLLKLFTEYHWPGNIRELKNGIDRLKILNPEKDLLNFEDLHYINFQDALSLPQKPETANEIKQTNLESLEIKQDPHLINDPILNILNQKGFKSKQRLMTLKQLFQKHL